MRRTSQLVSFLYLTSGLICAHNYDVTQSPSSGTLNAYEVMALYDDIPESHVIPEHSKDELEYEDVLTQISSATQTQFGRWGMQHLLQPKTDMSHIQTLQTTLHTLIENPDIRQELQHQLQIIRDSESSLISYFQESGDLSERLGNYLYYNTLQRVAPFLNYSPRALSLGVHCGPLLSIWGGVTLTLLPNWISQAKSYGQRVSFTIAESEWRWRDLIPSTRETREAFNKGTSAYLQSRYPGLNVLQDHEKYAAIESYLTDYHTNGNEESMLAAMMLYADPHSSATPSVGDTYTFTHLISGYKTLGICHALLQYTWDVYCGLSVYGGCRTLAQRYQTLDELYRACCDLARMIQAANNIQSILDHHAPAELMEQLPESSFITKQHTNDSAQELDQLLSSHTFHKTSQTRRAAHLRKHPKKYATGKVLTVHQLMCDEADVFIPLMEYIGTVDALTNIAETYVSHMDQDTQFCFAELDADRTTPYIKLDQFWTPLLPAKTAVCNDIELNSSNTILSGPNGIGKSTTMKGVAHAVIMAQSIGIAPAQYARISVFDAIDTYLNIREDISEGLSSFMAEKKRIDSLYEATRQQPGNTLYIIDEPFRGTYAQEAERRVFAFGEFIDQHPHVMMIMATHFAKPTTLEQEHRFKNYHIGIHEHPDGVYELTYQLQPGILHWWFNDEQKRAQFIDQLSEQM